MADVDAALHQEARDGDVTAQDCAIQHRVAVLVHVASVDGVQRAARVVHAAKKDRGPQLPLRAIKNHLTKSNCKILIRYPINPINLKSKTVPACPTSWNPVARERIC